MATNIGRAPSGAGWVHEIKFDGYRSQLHIRDRDVTIYTKNGHDWTDRYRSVADDAQKLKARHAVLDGEMVVLREDQTCDMWALLRDTRNRVSERLTLFAFDLLFVDGEDLRKRPLLERKKRLRELLQTAKLQRIRFCDHVAHDEKKNVDGPTVWARAHDFGVEGIVSKRVDSLYRGKRGDDWIKTPCEYRETVPIVGMAVEDGKLTGLYLARRKSGRLEYAGQLEEGLNDALRTELLAKLSPYIVKRPLVETITPKPDARWLEPLFNVRIAHRGGDGAIPIRRAVFEGLVSPKKAKAHSTSSQGLADNVMRELTDAVVPTKAQLRAHWRRYAKLALPHLANRPLTLVRHVDGVTFYHKGVLPPVANGVHQIQITKADGTPGIRVFVDSLEGLLGLVDMDVVEVHPWAARVDDIERPDLVILDLDPGEGIGWDFVLETAFELRRILADEGLDCWPKLTGGSGLHLMAPIQRYLKHDQVHECALRIAKRLAATNPRRYTTRAGASNRIGKLFIDHLRNGRGFTAVGAYSPRAREGLTVAIPTSWQMLQKDSKPRQVSLLDGKLSSRR